MQLQVDLLHEHFLKRLEELKEIENREYLEGYLSGINETLKIIEETVREMKIIQTDDLKKLLVEKFDDKNTLEAMAKNSSCLGGLEIEMANGTFTVHREVLEYLSRAPARHRG